MLIGNIRNSWLRCLRYQVSWCISPASSNQSASLFSSFGKCQLIIFFLIISIITLFYSRLKTRPIHKSFQLRTAGVSNARSFLVSWDFLKWKFMLSCWSVSFVSFCVYMSVFICLRPTDHNLRVIFIELHIQLGTSPRKNWLYYQGHGVKCEGHVANNQSIYLSRNTVHTLQDRTVREDTTSASRCPQNNVHKNKWQDVKMTIAISASLRSLIRWKKCCLVL